MTSVLSSFSATWNVFATVSTDELAKKVKTEKLNIEN